VDINLKSFSISSFEEAIYKKEKKCILYCDFNVANIIYEQNIEIPPNFTLYPDSSLMHFTLKLFYGTKIDKSISTDIQDQVLNLINKNKLKLYLFGDKEEILAIIKKNLLIIYHNISIVGYHSGYSYNSLEVIDDIKNTNPDILLVGLGAGRQENWLINNYTYLPSIIILSVGGYFQFLSKVKKRAPLYFRRINLEWLYRVITEFNSVWKKYSIFVIKFIYRILTNKINFTFSTDDK